MRKILLLSSLLVIIMFLVSCVPREEAVAGEAIKVGGTNRLPSGGKAAKPDLVVASAQFDLVLNASTGKKDVKYTATVMNKGTAATNSPGLSGTSLARFFVNFGVASGVPSADKQNYVKALQIGETVTVAGTYSPYSSDKTACPGTHVLNITADYLNQVAESNETNNGKQITVTC